MEQEIKSIFDIYEEEGYPLELTKMEELLNKELIVSDIQEVEFGKFGKSIVLMVEYKNKIHKVRTSSQVLRSQILPVAHKTPFTLKIVKEGQYYTIK